jgi:glucokinase
VVYPALNLGGKLSFWSDLTLEIGERLHAIGIDIGGTKIAGALVDDAGNILKEIKIPSPIDDSTQMVEAIGSVIAELEQGEQVIGVGVAAAGFMSADREIMYHSPNISAWRNEPLKKRIASQTHLPVMLENDANAAGWAEFRFGAGAGRKGMVMLTIGTGVGGAIISDGVLLKGGFGIGGELGHVVLIPGGRDCGCGQKGCVESYCSGTALLKSAKELAQSGEPKAKRLNELMNETGELSGEQVYQAILENDLGACELLEDLGRYLGTAIGTIYVPILDPELVVIGGGVSAVGKKLLDPIEAAFEESMPAKGYRPVLEIVKATFLNQAGLIGAADLARHSFA